MNLKRTKFITICILSLLINRLYSQIQDESYTILNNYYYNVKEMGLESFICNIEFSEFNNFKNMYFEKYPNDTHVMKLLNEITFTVNLNSNMENVFVFISEFNSNNEKLNSYIKQILTPYKNMATSFWQTWYEFSIKPIIETFNFDYKWTINRDSIFVSSKETPVSAILLIDEEFRINECILKSDSIVNKIMTGFDRLDSNFVLMQYKYISGNSGYNAKAHIEYSEYNGLLLPLKVKYTSYFDDNELETMMFFSYNKIQKE